MKLLVVEDDPKIGSFVTKGLREEGFTVDLAINGTDALELGMRGSFDAAIVDLMLPGLDGLSLIQRWREARIQTPVIILSAKRAVDDRVRGLQAGGDDYITKPFAFSELLARVQAVLRRTRPEGGPLALKVADLEMDLLRREVKRGETVISLQAREFSLLELMLRQAGRIVTKTAILEHVYDYSFDPQTNVVDVLVHRLRSKIDKDFEPKLIQTVRGMGYVLRA